MMRGLLKLVLFLVVIAALGAFILGYWSNGHWRGAPAAGASTVGTSGHVDTGKAREVGAELGEKSAIAAGRARAALDDAALTTKIKSKMALDDNVEARRIDVTTSAGIVTLSGTVSSQAERDRAVRLAHETAGVKSVNDRLQVR
jgi:hyperosmotically inducible protein